MPNHAKAVPAGYRNITPYLTINHADQAIVFYKKVFGAKEVMRFEGPDKKIGHAELQIGDSLIMLGDVGLEKEENTASTGLVSIHLYIADVDAVMKKAADAGAEIINQAEDKFYGDRSGMLKDPYGVVWCISTHIEDLSSDEVKERAQKSGVKLTNLVLPGPRHL